MDRAKSKDMDHNCIGSECRWLGCESADIARWLRDHADDDRDNYANLASAVMAALPEPRYALDGDPLTEGTLAEWSDANEDDPWWREVVTPTLQRLRVGQVATFDVSGTTLEIRRVA